MSVVARRYYGRGREALDRGDLDGAIEALRAALDLAPYFSSARVAYAVALTRMGDCPRAAQAVRAGLGMRASAVARAAMWATLGDILTTGGDFLGAEDAFRQAAATHPDVAARAASGLTRVYAKLGRYPEAFAQLRTAAAALAAIERPPADSDHTDR
jgi:tetratricopeptide (TPR) repeat protein